MARRPDPGALLRKLLAASSRSRRVRHGHRPGSPAKGKPVIPTPPVPLGPELRFTMQPASGVTEGEGGAFTFEGLRLIGPVTAAIFDRTTGREVAGAAVSGSVGAFTMPPATSSYEVRLTTPGLIGAIISAPFTPVAVVVTPPPEVPPPLLSFSSPPNGGQEGSAGTFTYAYMNLTGPVTAVVRNMGTGAIISTGTASGGNGAFVRPPVGVTWRVELTSPGAATQLSGSFTSTAAPVAPTITTQPTLAGTSQAGQQRTGTTGAASGTPAPTAAAEWLRDGAVVATGLTYTHVQADVGKQITFRVTWSNGTAPNATASLTTTTVSAAPATGLGPDDATIGNEPATIGGEPATVGMVPAAGANDATWNGQPVTWNGQPVTWTPPSTTPPTGPSANAATYDGEEVTYDSETVEYV